jgi:VWFA-related protein
MSLALLRHRGARQFLAFAFMVAAWPAVFAGQQGQQTTPVFRSSIDLVHFDVSVLDKDRRPVRGLAQTDFTVFEDGKTQSIAAFAAVDVPPPTPSPLAGWTREVSPDVRTNEPEQNSEGRLFVLLIDDALLPADPQAVQSAKTIARGVVDRLSPLDQLAIVFSFASRHSQNFTTDRGALLAAVDWIQAGPASYKFGWDNAVPKGRASPGTVGSMPLAPAVDSDMGLRLGSLNTLRQVAETLTVSSRRRKALIFVSPGVGVDLESDARSVKAVAGDPGAAIRDANHQLAVEMPEMFRRMARANVTVYSVDPCGLGGLEAYIFNGLSGVKALERGGPVPPFYHWLAPDVAPRPADLARRSATLDVDFLVAAATNTGGRAIVNTNDFTPGLDGIFAENASYYLLAYARPPKQAAGSLHRVTVKVNRPDVTVRTRSGYETETADPGTVKSPKSKPAPDAASASAFRSAIAGPVADGTLPLQLALAPVLVPPDSVAGQSTAVTIVVGLSQPAVGDRIRQTIDLQTSVYTPDGRAVGTPARQTATFTLQPRGGDVVRYEMLSQVALAPGRYELRVAAHRATDNLSGSVYADVTVPDFAKAPLSLSGVWLEASPGPTALGRDAFAFLLPVVPTASRVFQTSDQVTASMRIYQGGNAPLAPVSLNVRVVDEKDATMAEAAATVGIEFFDAVTHAADHRFTLPLRRLTPGRYLLRFDLSLGPTTARRDVVFTVR